MPVVGIRFRNVTGVDCFINVAVNVLATTEAIRRSICEEGNNEDVSTENNSGTVLSNIEGNWGNASNMSITPSDKRFVIRELSRLMELRGESIGDTIMLRKLLSQFFGIFGEIRQNDAGDALFSILECLPHIEKRFNISLRYVRTCLDCRNTKVSEASEGFINLDSHNYGGNVIGLQEALNAYQSSQGEMLMNCMCTSANEKSGTTGLKIIVKPILKLGISRGTQKYYC